MATDAGGAAAPGAGDGIRKVSVEAAEMTDAPFAPGDVVAGSPAARNATLLDDRDLQVGVFENTPGSVRTPGSAQETVYVLSGRATVTLESGEAVELRAGDLAVVPAVPATWEIAETFRVVYMLRS